MGARHARGRGQAAWASERPDAPADALTLVQIVDRPGTEDDKAVFEVTSGAKVERLTLGRRDGGWVNEGIA